MRNYPIDFSLGINFLRNSCFVLFFPHPIAGASVLYQDVRRQLTSRDTFRFNRTHLVLGLTIFTIGLFEKTCLADSTVPIADGLLGNAAAGVVPTFSGALIGMLASSVQLSRDLSRYSDMAIGLALMFNIRLTINFWSPQKSTSIIEFWSRWLITRFLTTSVCSLILMHLTRNGPR